METSGGYFLSYSGYETAFALRLAADLRMLGVNVWVDRLDVTPAAAWADAVQHALDDCTALLAVLSPGYAVTGYCREELDRALALDKPVFPVLARTVPDAAWPLPGGEKVCVDFRRWHHESAYQEALQELFARLQQQTPSAISLPPDAETQYLTNLIATLEGRQIAALAELPRSLDDAGDELARPRPAADFHWLVDGPFEVIEGIAESRRFDGIWDVATHHPRFALVGPAGSGKTTVMQQLILAMARARLADPVTAPCPLFVEAADWLDDDTTPQAFLRAAWPVESDVIDLLGRGEVVLFLDGLGETAATRSQMQRLQAWFQAADAPKIAIIACHSRALRHGVPADLPVVQAARWTADRVREFVQANVTSDADIRRVLYWLLPDGGQPVDLSAGLQDVLYHPFLLQVLAQVAAEQPAGEPLRRYSLGALTQRVVGVLWERQTLDAAVSFEALSTGLSELAFAMMAADMPVYVPYAYAARHLEDEALLEARNSGVFLRVVNGHVRFVHQLVQWFFAAQKLQTLPLREYLTPPQFDPSERRIPQRWDPAVIIMAGLAANLETTLRDIAAIDPYLALTCVYSGLDLLDNAHEQLIRRVLRSRYIDSKIGRVEAVRLIPVNRHWLGLSTLLEAMRNGTWDARWAAMDTLLDIDPPLLAGVEDALQSTDQALNNATLTGLRSIGETAIISLIQLVHGGLPELRIAAARALGQMGDRAAVPGLVRALQADDPAVAAEAAAALGWLRDTEAIPWLLTCLDHTEAAIADAAAQSLGWLGAPAVNGMLEAVRDAAGPDVRTRVIAALKPNPDRVVQGRLLDATYDTNVEIRSAAVEALEDAEGDVFLKRMVENLNDNARSRWQTRRIADVAEDFLKVRGYDGESLPLTEEEQTPVAQDGSEKRHRDKNKHSAETARQRLQHTLAETRVDPAAQPAGDHNAATMHSSDWEQRRDAVLTLQYRDADTAIPLLIKALEDTDSYVRIASVQALQAFDSDEALRGLFIALNDPDVQVCDAASDAFRLVGKRAVPYLLQALHAAGVNMRGGAVEALGKIADATTIPRLVEMLDDKARPRLSEKRICDLAADALRAIGTPESLQAVLRWQGENASDPRTTALVEAELEEALQPEAVDAPLDSPAQRKLFDLLEQLEHDEWGVRQEAAKELREHAKTLKHIDDPVIMHRLLQALQSDAWVIRWAVAEALAWVGNASAVPSLTELLHDDSWIVRVAALRALMELEDARAVPAVQEALTDPKDVVREAAAETLGVLGDAAMGAALLPVLHDRESFVRLAAVHAIGRLQVADAVGGLQQALTDEDANVRWAAVGVLGGLRLEESVPALIDALMDVEGPYWEDKRICDVAAEALEGIGTPAARAAVETWRSQQAQQM